MDPTGKDKRTRSPENMRVRVQGGQQGWQRREGERGGKYEGTRWSRWGMDRARKEL